MQKTYNVLPILVFCSMLYLSPQTLHAQVLLGSQDAYKAIVEIKAYTHSLQHDMSYFSQGSGVLVGQDGLVLTNHHVITYEESFDSTERKVGYTICVTEGISREPDCSFAAKLIAKDKDLDIALLKIEPIQGLSDKQRRLLPWSASRCVYGYARAGCWHFQC